MLLKKSINAKTKSINQEILDLLDSLSFDYIRKVVSDISIPRHFFAERENNKFVANYIEKELIKFGFETFYQGKYANLVALNKENKRNKGEKLILIGAHYDSVPDCPGADDNASAIAALLVCAKAIYENNVTLPICFVAFNSEEDGLIGSLDFVNNYLPESGLNVVEAHILEMVGYSDTTKGSQTIPVGLPINVPDVGNFLAIIGKGKSNNLVNNLVENSKTYLPELSVIGLKLYFAMERIFPDLTRSDHNAFWQAKIPATMWTDTSEFRNPHYHQITDTPETLNYSFLYKVAQLLLLHLITKNKTVKK